MDRKEALEIVLKNEPTFLPKAPVSAGGHPTYICPECGNGSGEDGTGIAYDVNGKDPSHPHWKCFKCGIYADIADLWQRAGHYPDTASALTELYSYYGLTVDEKTIFEAIPETTPAINPYTIPYTEKLRPDDLSYTTWATENISKSDYMQRRGISLDTCRKFHIGFDPDRYFYKDEKTKVWIHGPAVIIPVDDKRHCWRCTNPTLMGDTFRPNGKYTRKTKNDDESEEETKSLDHGFIFNYQALHQKGSEPVYVVEGEIDALSILEAGGTAVSLGGLGRIHYFLSYCRRMRVQRTLIFVLDNDDAGKCAAQQLQDTLNNSEITLNAYVLTAFNAEGTKDANEFLVKFGVNGMRTEFDRIRRIRLRQHEKDICAAAHLKGFVENIRVQTPPIPTGFHLLDTTLDDGLYEGLYVIGAISSLGKTAFAIQIADQIAEQGNEALIFALEMSRNELMARSISRHTLIRTQQDKQFSELKPGKTARGITNTKRYKYYSDSEKMLIGAAIKDYANYAPNIYISEGIGDISAIAIRSAIAEHIELMDRDKRLVVVVDYAQILAPCDDRLTDKQNMDRNILELKRISRDYKIPIIVISSFNRESYSMPVTMAAFKESGAIEYSSDVLIGLQLQGVGDKGFNVDAAKAQDPRQIELKILKNRSGKTGITINYAYYPAYNYFVEKMPEL